MTAVPKAEIPSTIDAVNALDLSLREISALSAAICGGGLIPNDAATNAERLCTLVRMITERAEAAQHYADYLYDAWSALHSSGRI